MEVRKGRSDMELLMIQNKNLLLDHRNNPFISSYAFIHSDFTFQLYAHNVLVPIINPKLSNFSDLKKLLQKIRLENLSLCSSIEDPSNESYGLVEQSANGEEINGFGKRSFLELPKCQIHPILTHK